jgi:D-alanyl-D-alanine carboxypeptidase (penicillin-binding protein 5/6)
MIMVINGTKSEKERSEEARKLLDWGLRGFERVSLFRKGEVIADARVFGGAQPSVGLVSKDPVDVMLPRGSRDLIKGRIVYRGPIPAPVEEGQEVGTLQITLADDVLRETPVYADGDIGRGTIPQRSLDAVKELLLGWW